MNKEEQHKIQVEFFISIYVNITVSLAIVKTLHSNGKSRALLFVPGGISVVREFIENCVLFFMTIIGDIVYIC